MNDKQTILRRIRDVPSLPSVVIRIRQYLDDPDVSFDTLAKAIEHDPGLTANILRLANSAYFGWSRRVKTVRDAITRLGTNRIFQMVLCMSVAPLVRKPIKGYDMEASELWEHSFAVAVIAEKLTQVLGLRGHEEAFTAGLLHDLGKVVLGTFVEVDDAPIKRIVQREGKTFTEAERQVLGMDHAETAGELLRLWNLPAEVADAVQWHHEPSSCGSKHRAAADLLHAADTLAMRAEWGVGLDVDYCRVDEEAFGRLGLTAEVVDEVMLLATPEFEEMRELYLPHMAPQEERPKEKV